MRILSMCTPSYNSLRDVTWPTKAAYAAKWGHSITHETHLEPYDLWERPKLWRENLHHSGWLLFSACDVAITNQNIDIANLIDDHSEFICCSDGNGLNADSWLMKECYNSLKFLDDVIAMQGKAIHEQDAMVHVMAATSLSERYKIKPFQDGSRIGWFATHDLMELAKREFNQSPLRVKVVPQRQLNAYDAETYGISGDHWWSWHPGDFCCHMVARTLDERIHHFKRILSL